MKDKILEGFLSDFSQKYSLETLGEDDQFEQFVNFNLVSKLYPKILISMIYLWEELMITAI